MTPWRAITCWTLIALAATGCEPSHDSTDAGEDAAPDGGDTDTDTDSDTDEDAGDDDAGDDAGDAGEGGTDTESGDGTCDPIDTLEPGVPVSGTTEGATNDLDGYSCTALDESGPDVAYIWVNEADTPLEATATLTGLDADLDLFLLLPSCDIASCVAHSASQADESASAVVEVGQPLFVAIDGFLGAAGNYELQIQTEPIELACDDGLDDDGDALTDCADDDCLLDPACVQTCESEGPIACGDVITGTTEGAEDTIQVYGSYATDFDGPERIFAFGVGAAGTQVEARIDGTPPDLELLVLAETCASDAAVLSGPTIAVFAPIPTVDYFVIVDGRNGAAGEFELSLSCSESSCDDDTDNDSDGMTDCADIDCELIEPCVVPCTPLSLDGGCAPVGDGGAPDAGDDAGPWGPACYPLLPDPLAGFCHEPGDAGVGAPCVVPYQCAPGTTCSPADICLKYCDLDDGVPGCDAGDCTSLGSDPLGVCWE